MFHALILWEFQYFYVILFSYWLFIGCTNFWVPFIGFKNTPYLCQDTKNEIQRIFVNKMRAAVLLAILAIAYTLDNGLALTPPMVTILKR